MSIHMQTIQIREVMSIICNKSAHLYASGTFVFLFITLLSQVCTVHGYGESHRIQEITHLEPGSRFFAVAYGTKDSSSGVIDFDVVNGTDSEQQLKNSEEVATAVLYVDTNNTGWSYLTVRSSDKFNDVIQAYWGGYLEGLVSWTLMKAQHYNRGEDYCLRPYTAYCVRLLDYVQRNLKWMKSQVLLRREREPFWHQVELQLWQLKGIEDAFYNRTAAHSSKELDVEAFKKLTLDPFGPYLLQLHGDLEDLELALERQGNRQHNRVIGDGSCSVLIKVLPNNQDLYVAHDTWSNYGGMLRVLKHYELPFSMTANEGSDIVPGTRMSFSSYPGVASSGDDFYIMDTGLVAVETTNGNYNASLWDEVIHGAESTVFEFLRSQVANRLAKFPLNWGLYFKQYNSGTYNNQWMIVDYKKFQPGHELPDSGLLVVLEQIPTLVTITEMTMQLKQNSYWASYNIPAFPVTFKKSGYEEMVRKYGDWFTHEGSPRGQIFKRDHGKVQNMESMIDMMRYNDFQHDPVSRCNCTPPYSAENAIAARSDLNPKDGVYPFGALGFRDHGATDMKLVNSSLAFKMNFVALSGPTHTQQPAFKWSNSTFDTARHLLHPDEWNFSPILTPF